MIDRAALEGLYNEAAAASENGDGTVDSGQVAALGGGPAPDQSDAGGNPEDGGAQSDAKDEKVLGEQRPRDASGKFAPKDKATREVKDKAIQTKQGGKEVTAPASAAANTPDANGAASLEQPAPAAAEQVRAPQSLTPAEREVFAKAPPEIQKALVRIDQTTRQSLQEAAPIKRFHQEMSQALAPIRGLMQMRGVSEAQAVSSYANFDRMLSDPATSAQAAAQLLRSYNVNIEHLAAHLDRTPAPAQGQQGQGQSLNPNDIASQVLQVIRQERTQSTQQKLMKDVEAFAADPKNEFFEDVHPRMTALLNADPQLTLKDAYEEAVWSRKDLRAIIQKREAEKAGKASTVSTQQKRLAASSVKSRPSTGASVQTAAPKNHRDMVAAVYDSADAE